MKKIQEYEAIDGKRFPTEKECREYEQSDECLAELIEERFGHSLGCGAIDILQLIRETHDITPKPHVE
jgi:hypothetical protein